MSLALKTCTRVICGVMLLTSIGCATFQLPFGDNRIRKASAHNPVTQIVCIWQPSEGRDPDGLPCRGFAGQILFLANRGSLPVQIDGEVRIYLFDDHGTTEEQSRPLHLYNFDSKSWAIHLTKGTLGPTYSVFIPYTRRGNYEAKCALRVRMTSPSGEHVFSELATIPLDGKKSVEVRDGKVAGESLEATNAVSQPVRRTTTISQNGETTKAKPGESRPISTGVIQLANHEVGNEPVDANRQRVDQLEQIVQQLLEQQKQQPTQRSGGEAHAVETRPTESTPQFKDDSAANDLDFPPHPLTSEVSKGHPLEGLDVEVARPAERTASKPRRDPLAGHPLAAFDEELSREEFARKGPRQNSSQPVVNSRDESASPARSLRATEPTERRERSWSDPFEPINTEAIETTSLEPETVRRQRLRAAR